MHYWHCWAVGEDGTPAWFAAVGSDVHADREPVRVPEAEALALVGDAPALRVDLDPAGEGVALRVSGDLRSRVRDLWFYEVAERSAPPATLLVAFTGHGVPEASLRRLGDLGDPPVGSSDQLAAVRWFPGTGEVDQVYVAPDARRKGLATHLVLAADALAESRGEPRLWGDGQRTDLGEAWLETRDWSSQVAPRTHVAPPMTPGDPG